MKKFVFRLEKVLDHRRTVEDDRKSRLARADRLLRENEKMLQDLCDTEDRCRAELKEKQGRALAINEILLAYDHLNTLGNAIEAQRAKVREMAVQREAARKDLMTARQDRQVLEKLKEKSLRAYRERADKAEQKAIDEAGTAQFNRREKDHGA